MDKKSQTDTLSNNTEKKSVGRRDFFKKTAALAGTALLASNATADENSGGEGDKAILEMPEWATKWGDPLTKNLYGMPSKYEHNVTRRYTKLLASGNFRASIAVTPIQESMGIITPNGLFFSRSHGGTAHIDPNEHRLMITGLEKSLVLTMDELKRYPSVTRTHFIECPANSGQEWRGPQYNSVQFSKGFMSCAEWTGVYIKDILKGLGYNKDNIGKLWMLAEGGDSSKMGRTIPMEKVWDDAMVVWGQNGEALRPEQGYPIRLLVPGWEGNLCVKWLRRLDFANEPWYCKEETSKYTVLKSDGKIQQHTYANEVNSTVTSPSPEIDWSNLKEGDVVEIEGLAWSGMGTITKVDLSFDGGKNYVEAQLKGLVLPKCWTRWSYIFTIPKNFQNPDGSQLLLTSRAMDDAGYIQPTVDQELTKVGVEAVYHRNAVETWRVEKDGKVNHVQVRSDLTRDADGNVIIKKGDA
ncbi:MAG: sulfite dehydrogenase [Epsilonproteobacteria bacterium]|nr:sulfite dehydrogenase [Campylobacterota bacterium]